MEKQSQIPQLPQTTVISRIFKVVGFLDKNGFGKRIQEIEVTETAKSFVADGKRISKDKIMKIDSIFLDNHNYIRYYTYCFDGQQQEALDKLKEHITSKVMKYKEEIDVLVSYL